jgi:hypothetical protein
MRSCIIETTVENRAIIEAHLPPGVKVAAVNKPFERPVVELRLEGDSLPPWAEISKANYYMRAMLDILADGTTRLNPGCGIPVQQIHPDVKE